PGPRPAAERPRGQTFRFCPSSRGGMIRPAMLTLKSPPPRVKLTKVFTTPFDNAVATARTCYSSRIVTDADVAEKPALRDRIAQSIYLAGHHTTLQHAHFQFTLENVSRQVLWSFFH